MTTQSKCRRCNDLFTGCGLCARCLRVAALEAGDFVQVFSFPCAQRGYNGPGAGRSHRVIMQKPEGANLTAPAIMYDFDEWCLKPHP